MDSLLILDENKSHYVYIKDFNRFVFIDKNNGSCTEKYQDHIPCSFAYKLLRVDNKFSKDVVLYRGKNAVYQFIEAILKEHNYCREVLKNTFYQKSYYVCRRRRKISIK